MADILKERGNEAFKKKDFLTADSLYKDAITLDPQNAVLYSNRSLALIKLEKWKDCIDVVNAGLLQDPDMKTKVKLLWRKGTALVELNEFKDARQSYQDTLSIESNNQSVLKSIEELDRKESQFKRSHSIDEFETDKRIKTQNSIEKIPIYEVDELPIEFQQNTDSTIKTSSKTTQTPSFKEIHTSISNTKPKIPSLIQEIKPTSTNLEKSINNESYAAQPTIHLLSSIANSIASTSTLEYVFNVSSSQYSKLFQNGNIDHRILNLILESIIYSLETNPNSIDKAKELLITFPNIPRFSLVQFFVDKEKLNKIRELTNNSDEIDNWN